MGEDWIYNKAFKAIKKEHNLSFKLLYDYKERLALSCEMYGTRDIQIDIFAIDKESKIIVMIETKEWLAFQGVSECAEQIVLKRFLISHYYCNRTLGRDNKEDYDNIDMEELNNYFLLKYVALGSYSGENYENAKAVNIEDMKKRIDEYSYYLSFVNRNNTGIIIFLNKDSDDYAIKKATKEKC